MQKNPDHKKNIVALKRIEGQVRGLQRMIDERKYCIDIIGQIESVKGALARVEREIFQTHLENCVVKALKGRSDLERSKKIDEIMETINKLQKS